MSRRTQGRKDSTRTGDAGSPVQDDALHRYVTESSASGLFLIENNRIRWANAAAAGISGYSVEELSEIDPSLLLHPESRLTIRAILEQPPQQGRPNRCEIRIVDRNGMEKWLELTGARISYQGSPAFVGTAIDITDRKRLETQFLQSQKMEALGRLAGGVAHDFNNLLTVMAGYAQMAINRLDPASGVRADLEEIIRNTSRAAALTSQLLAFSRKQSTQPRVLDLNALLDNTLKMLGRMIGEDIRLEARQERATSSIRADPGQIEQVIMNLAVNARDAMPRGGVLRLATSQVKLPDLATVPSSGLPPGDYVVLSVSDNGPGMNSETLSRIFEPFFTTKELGKGTGLGLSTVYGIVRQSGGDIAVESSPGKGSTFKVLFPSVKAPAESRIPDTSTAASAPGTETILLVEDDSYLRSLLKNALTRQNYTVVEAENGPAGIRAMRKTGRFDLVITDVVMPGITGVEMVERIMRRRPDLRVLYISGYSDPPISAGEGRMLLRKPFTLPELARVVRNLLDSSPRVRRAGR
jgi:two-component system, cell cycle sensor histidine kinase and response regulator CckA